jgi:16S rRNA G966 N2-methylase RsmD
MTENEMLKISVEEFSRVQNYMVLSEKDSEAYKVMKQRYIELKVILTASGVNITELDIIKE